jgi:hypothetical protein
LRPDERGATAGRSPATHAINQFSEKPQLKKTEC